MREDIDAELRVKWEHLYAALRALALDTSGAGWNAAVDGATGARAMLAELKTALREAKKHPTYPPVVLQLEGPLVTIEHVLRHAVEAGESLKSMDNAARLRGLVLDYLTGELERVKANIEASKE